ncbi:MAG TPA: transglutaminase domain-containing protein [Gryllotalpicola sp.]
MSALALTTILTPWYRRRAPRAGRSGSTGEPTGSTAPTPILDHRSAPVRRLVDRATVAAASSDALPVLEAAYAIIRDEIRAVYALDESTPASRTLTRGFGSCSQRLAVLESAARALGIPTRVRALLIDRSFWYPRFPHLGFALPGRVLLVWPEFEVEGAWRPASELFGPIGCQGGPGFANRGAETLFEAVGRCAVDWDGRHREGRDHDDAYDLSRFVRADLGRYRDRDEAFARLGQTLCAPSRALADPIMRRVAA